jgi:hypothetical protein
MESSFVNRLWPLFCRGRSSGACLKFSTHRKIFCHRNIFVLEIERGILNAKVRSTRTLNVSFTDEIQSWFISCSKDEGHCYPMVYFFTELLQIIKKLFPTHGFIRRATCSRVQNTKHTCDNSSANPTRRIVGQRKLELLVHTVFTEGVKPVPKITSCP